MDEKKRILKVIEKTDEQVQGPTEEVKPKNTHPNQTNPIFKKLAQFTNSKIGDKLSIRDLLR